MCTGRSLVMRSLNDSFFLNNFLLTRESWLVIWDVSLTSLKVSNNLIGMPSYHKCTSFEAHFYNSQSQMTVPISPLHAQKKGTELYFQGQMRGGIFVCNLLKCLVWNGNLFFCMSHSRDTLGKWVHGQESVIIDGDPGAIRVKFLAQGQSIFLT